MFRTSLSVGGVALVLVGFAGCGSTPRDFSRTAAGSGGTAGKSETSQGGLGGHGEAGDPGEGQQAG